MLTSLHNQLYINAVRNIPSYTSSRRFLERFLEYHVWLLLILLFRDYALTRGVTFIQFTAWFSFGGLVGAYNNTVCSTFFPHLAFDSHDFDKSCIDLCLSISVATFAGDVLEDTILTMPIVSQGPLFI